MVPTLPRREHPSKLSSSPTDPFAPSLGGRACPLVVTPVPVNPKKMCFPGSELLAGLCRFGSHGLGTEPPSGLSSVGRIRLASPVFPPAGARCFHGFLILQEEALCWPFRRSSLGSSRSRWFLAWGSSGLHASSLGDTSKASGARAGRPVGSSKFMILGKEALLVSGLVLLDSSIGSQQAHGRLLFSVSALSGRLSPGPGRGLFLAIRAPRLGDEDLSTPGRVTPSWGWHRGSWSRTTLR